MKGWAPGGIPDADRGRIVAPGGRGRGLVGDGLELAVDEAGTGEAGVVLRRRQLADADDPGVLELKLGDAVRDGFAGRRDHAHACDVGRAVFRVIDRIHARNPFDLSSGRPAAASFFSAPGRFSVAGGRVTSQAMGMIIVNVGGVNGVNTKFSIIYLILWQK